VAKCLIIERLDRLTLTQKGMATAKHPLLREGVVEVVKATPEEQPISDLYRDAVTGAIRGYVRRTPAPEPKSSLPTFEDTFRAIVRGEPVASTPPALGSFEAACKAALHARGAPLPQPWRTEKVQKSIAHAPHLHRFHSGQWG
jgi:hypothetical protein